MDFGCGLVHGCTDITSVNSHFSGVNWLCWISAYNIVIMLENFSFFKWNTQLSVQVKNIMIQKIQGQPVFFNWQMLFCNIAFNVNTLLGYVQYQFFITILAGMFLHLGGLDLARAPDTAHFQDKPCIKLYQEPKLTLHRKESSFKCPLLYSRRVMIQILSPTHSVVINATIFASER